jgi:hypothetical protein
MKSYHNYNIWCEQKVTKISVNFVRVKFLQHQIVRHELQLMAIWLDAKMKELQCILDAIHKDQMNINGQQKLA